MTNERDFKGVWIPKEIYVNRDLNPTEKFLLVEIDSLAKNGECFASNEHFAQFLQISKDRVSKLLTKLRRMGLIEIVLIYKQGSKEIEKRIITPLGAVTYTPRREHLDPIGADTDTPLGADAYDNNTVINNTNNNTISINKKINKKGQKNSNSAELESEFESLWRKYPRKIGKAKALQSYIKARKSKKYTYEQIDSGLNKYIEYLEMNGTDEQFIQHGSTWFNQENFLSEYESTQFQKKPQLSRFNQNMMKHMENPDDFLNLIGVESYEQRPNRKILDSGEVKLS